ncbi:protein angel homolog 2 isoform X2 [Antennarius striatus]
MFVRPLSLPGFFLHPRSPLALCRPGPPHPHTSSPGPWWSTSRQVFAVSTPQVWSIRPENVAGRVKEMSTGSREPPPKRKRSVEEGEGEGEGASGGMDGRNGGSRREQHPSSPSETRPNQHRLQEDSRRSQTPNPPSKGGNLGERLPPNRCQLTGADRRPPARQRNDVQPIKSLQRHWDRPTSSAGVPAPSHRVTFDFLVMSYNILSQELLQENAYLYQHCSPDILDWNHRLSSLLQEIKTYSADILCLQEVQEDHYENQIKPALQALGYQCEYKKRTRGKPDGCAILFKSSRLSLLSSHPVEFFRPGDALLDRDNVGLVVLLQPKYAMDQSDPSDFICVANTHLLYNPRRGDVKLAQLAILLAEIGRLSRAPNGSTSPVLLCGDFNSTPWSPLYNFLTTGFLNYRGLEIGMVSGQQSGARSQRLLKYPIWSRSVGIDHTCQFEKDPAAESSSSCPTGTVTQLQPIIAQLVSWIVQFSVVVLFCLFSTEVLRTSDDLNVILLLCSVHIKLCVSSEEGGRSNPPGKAPPRRAPAFNRAALKHNLKLRSSYEYRMKPDMRPEVTTCHSRTATAVDYILYTPEFSTQRSLPGGWGLRLLSRLSLVSQVELEEVNGLPNRFHSSDHIPLVVRFSLTRQ